MTPETKRLFFVGLLTAMLILLAGVVGLLLTKDIKIETALSFIVDIILK